MDSLQVTHADISGEVVWHGCIFRQYADISGIMGVWASLCSAFAVAQHEPDEEVDRVHCHIMLINCSQEVNTIQKKAKSIDPTVGGQGQWWISKKVQKGQYKGQLYKRIPLLKYLLKGDAARLKYSKNISPAEVEEAVSAWIPDESKDPTPQTPQKSEAKAKQTETHFEICEQILLEAKAKHPNWFKVSMVNYLDEHESEFTIYPEYYQNIWDLMITTLRKKKIRTSINELERFYITIMRNEYDFKHLLFQNCMRKIKT